MNVIEKIWHSNFLNTKIYFNFLGFFHFISNHVWLLNLTWFRGGRNQTSGHNDRWMLILQRLICVLYSRVIYLIKDIYGKRVFCLLHQFLFLSMRRNDLYLLPHNFILKYIERIIKMNVSVAIIFIFSFLFGLFPFGMSCEDKKYVTIHARSIRGSFHTKQIPCLSMIRAENSYLCNLTYVQDSCPLSCGLCNERGKIFHLFSERITSFSYIVFF